MPIVSKAQQGWMFANKPEMAKRWAKETPSFKNLPEHVKKNSLKKTLRKHTGKGGPILNPYAQASSPINLLKVGSPPTVKPIPKSQTNSMGK